MPKKNWDVLCTVHGWVKTISETEPIVCPTNGSDGGFQTAEDRGFVASPPSRYDAVTAPSASNDTNQGYSVGSTWINTNTGTTYTCVDATSTAAVWKNTTQMTGCTIEYYLIEEEASPGTDGGVGLSGQWNKRKLTTLYANGFTNLTLDTVNSRFTVQPGMWFIRASAPAYGVGTHKIRLYNVTSAAIAIEGTSEKSKNTAQTSTRSFLVFQGQLLVPTTFQIDHWIQITSGNVDFGVAAGTGSEEVYTLIELQKMASSMM